MEPETEKGRSLLPEDTAEPETTRGRAMTPDALFRLFVERVNTGDLDGLMELYEPDGAVVFEPGNPTVGHDAIRAAFGQMLASKPQFSAEGQRPSLVVGDIAITSARLGPDAVTAEVARQQMDGSWLWVIDNPNFLA
ncbi:MAG TPA: nuclear transport factor 2 family protein [Thermomicrobiales bacterium]|nr:nuclear transport factor 2 family protein [Thermomicrobiales bacterium]